MKKILSIGSLLLFVIGLLWLAAYGYHRYQNQKVEKIIVHIQRNGKKGFLDAKKIKIGIQKKENILGEPIKNISTGKIEAKLKKNPYVEAVDVYFNLLGDMVINIRERVPLMRVFNENYQSCYVDTKGTIFPVSLDFSPRVLPVNGYISTRFVSGDNIFENKYKKTPLPSLFLLAKKIEQNPFLKADISQLFVNSRGKIDMVPELGKYIIHLGDTIAMNIKLENLTAFSEQVFAHGGWSKYKSINLEFTNQVVCTKK